MADPQHPFPQDSGSFVQDIIAAQKRHAASIPSQAHPMGGDHSRIPAPYHHILLVSCYFTHRFIHNILFRPLGSPQQQFPFNSGSHGASLRDEEFWNAYDIKYLYYDGSD